MVESFPALRRSLLVAGIASSLALGCVSTTTNVRKVGQPSRDVKHETLRVKPRDEVVVSRDGSKVHLEVTQYEMCRRREILRQRQVREETSRVSTGTLITSLVMSVVLFPVGLVAGGAIVGVSALQTGTKTTELSPAIKTRTRVARCHRKPAAAVAVAVTSAATTRHGNTDERGMLVLDEVASGPLEITVNGRAPARVRNRKRSSPALAAPAVTPPAGTPPPRPTPPVETASIPSPAPGPPAATRPAASVLPPPPPPPPGARVDLR